MAEDQLDAELELEYARTAEWVASFKGLVQDMPSRSLCQSCRQPLPLGQVDG